AALQVLPATLPSTHDAMAARLTLLEGDAAPEQLLAAIVAHHRRWFVEQVRWGGGEVRRERGATWVLARDAEYHSIAFPRLKSATAGEQIDAILEYYRGREPRKLVICWSAHPPQPRDLGARLTARGFDFCWPLNWMALDLRRL